MIFVRNESISSHRNCHRKATILCIRHSGYCRTSFRHLTTKPPAQPITRQFVVGLSTSCIRLIISVRKGSIGKRPPVYGLLPHSLRRHRTKFATTRFPGTLFGQKNNDMAHPAVEKRRTLVSVLSVPNVTQRAWEPNNTTFSEQ
jgi:hypothetical protein